MSTVNTQSQIKAMILAAGEGTRLRPLTLKTPKALLPVAGVPLIEHILLWLKRHSISEVALNLHHLGDKISDFLGDGSRLGMKVVYSKEENILGTAGGVKRMEHFFDGTFAVVYGDTLTDFDLGAMLRFHRIKNSMATIALLELNNPWEVGVVEINKEGQILNFVEKPPRGSEPSNLSSGGIYILEKSIFDYIPVDGAPDFGYDVFPKLTELKLPVYGYIMKPEDYWIDIGSIGKYEKANKDVKYRKRD